MTYNFKNPEMRIMRNLNMSFNRKFKYGWKLNERPMFKAKDIQKVEMIPNIRGKILITINGETGLIDLPVLSLSEINEIKKFLKKK